MPDLEGKFGSCDTRALFVQIDVCSKGEVKCGGKDIGRIRQEARAEGDRILSEEDMVRLGDRGKVNGETLFETPGSDTLRYGVNVESDLKDIDASFQEGRILIRIPAHLAEDWLKSEKAGIRRAPSEAEPGRIEVIIEKDLPRREAREARE